MKIQQSLYDENGFSISKTTVGFDSIKTNLLLVFAQRVIFEKFNIVNDLKLKYPNAQIVFCSTSGNILEDQLIENKIVITAIQFEKTSICALEFDINHTSQSNEIGQAIANSLSKIENLKSILFFTEGSKANGTELIKGINSQLNKKVTVSGGIAGDDAYFQKTLVGLNQHPQEGKIVAIGFYGNDVSFAYSSIGGWKDYGPERVVTKSDKNILYKIDEHNALDLYKEYLGKYTTELPGSALFFPLSMSTANQPEPVVRTILSLDEINKSMTFAGDIPEGSVVRFMQSNLDNLISAAEEASLVVKNQLDADDSLAILISCVGRKLTLSSRIEEELEISKQILGQNCTSTGFYSYGEFSPTKKSGDGCVLHNQTMTITLIKES